MTNSQFDELIGSRARLRQSSSVHEHCASLLAPVNLWMVGGIESALYRGPEEVASLAGDAARDRRVLLPTVSRESSPGQSGLDLYHIELPLLFALCRSSLWQPE